MNIQTLTSAEWDIVAHRLGASDAIAEALTDCFDGDEPSLTGYLPERIEARANELLDNGPASVDWGSDLDLAILKDCCDGSTYFANLEDAIANGEISKGKAMAQIKAAYSLGSKIGSTISMP